MRLTVVGCSGSFAGPGSAASSYLVQTEHEGRTWNLLLDLGSGALGPLQSHVDLADLDAVVLSHLHPDHCADLLGLYVTRRYRPDGPLPRRMPVHGPAGTAERLALMYHGLEPGGMESEFDIVTVQAETTFTVGPFRVTPHPVNHPVEAYGYRVEADGAVLAFTGDTDDCPALDPLLRGADLALLDAAFVEGRDETRGIHLTARRAAEAAVRAGGVRRLVLTHVPAWNDLEAARTEADEVWPGRVELAAAGARYEVGADADPLDRSAARGMWAAYRAATPGLPVEGDPPVEWFGDSPELADALLAYVLGGTKRATAGLVAELVAAGEPLPRVGGHWVVCDGSGAPRLVLRTTELRVGPLSSVDERFAWDEGEGDRSLASWLEAHHRYFRRSCARIGVEFSDGLDVCFERFRVVWPPEHADT
ncbi:ASCH domain-containing protein [Phycicoccus sp. CSK15P-2]|uniref:MBL fold metallo-hydrolase n=1 Tax=Phycicoccus sp. CSK15P-2 TaxID=2807627 RepID=UPI00194DDAE7|nr:MBL fold metallo-hydrolase [Phycicoccus sp. CSK15P-2]MBM6404302.1 ASCH domain-containing protein [Phycicoccus sp. CSK15P-2]